MLELILGYILQIALTFGMIALFGFIIALLRRAFCAVSGRAGPKTLLITGIVGTPIHELSHALMCLVFGHKITEIKLYQPKSRDGVLGYVSHSYNRKNIYHQIGNFFIGTAPILLGGVVLMLVMLLLLPDAFDSIVREFEYVSALQDIFPFLLTVLEALFTKGFDMWQTWVFLILAIMITSHMEMSAADIKGSLGGLGILSLLWLIASSVIFFISEDTFESITSACISFALMLTAFFSIAIIFLALLLLIALILRLLTIPFRR